MHAQLYQARLVVDRTEDLPPQTWQGRSDVPDLLYGRERIAGLLAFGGYGTSEQLVRAVIADVARYSEGIAQSDDITLPAMRYLGTAMTAAYRLRGVLADLANYSPRRLFSCISLR